MATSRKYGYDTKGNVVSSNVYVKAMYDVSALGNAQVPTEATMVAWRKNQNLTQTTREDFARDARGQLTGTTSYAQVAADGTGIFNAATTLKETFVFDASGNLLNHVTGAIGTSTTVDGLGRTISSTDSLARTTTTVYAGNTVKTTAPNGLITTQTYDADGRLTSVTLVSSGVAQNTQNYFYDSIGNLLRTTDATGVTTWVLYDAASRLIATIDGMGVMTELVLDAAGLPTQKVTYATPVNTALLVDASGKPNNPPIGNVRPVANATADRRINISYDGAGRQTSTTDPVNLVNSQGFDGAGRISFEHQTDLNTNKTRGSWITQLDADGNRTPMFDQANFSYVDMYNGAGQRSTWNFGNQQYLATIYDGAGRVVGQLDENNGMGGAYLTETVYNANGQVDHTTRYATPWANFAYNDNAGFNGYSINTVRPAASSADETTSFTYDADGRVSTMTAPDGTQTSYTYELNTDRVASSTVGVGRADASTIQRHYDAWGRVIGQLSGVGSATLGTNPTAAQIATAWATYGTQYTYDAAGRLATQKDPLGHTTQYFYDNAGHLRFTVDAQNMVTERRYDSFGNVTLQVRYAAAVNMTGVPAGGLVTAALTSAVSAIAQTSKDEITRTVYDQMGHVTLSISAAGSATTFVNNAFGDVLQTRLYNQTVSVAVALGYTDTQLVTLVTGAADAARDQITSMSYDADGHLTVLADSTGAVTLYTPNYRGDSPTVTRLATRLSAAQLLDYAHLSTAYTTSAADQQTYNIYDESGRVVLSFDPAGYGTEFLRDANGNVTSEVRFAKSWSTVFGNTAIYGYFNGVASLAAKLSDPVNDRVTRNVYDKDNRLVLTVDPTGAATSYAYDSAGDLRQQIRYANAVPASAFKAGGDSDTQLLARMGTLAGRRARPAHRQRPRRRPSPDAAGRAVRPGHRIHL